MTGDSPKSKVQLQFLGTGSAFTVGDGNYQSNMLLTVDGQRLLIDCGADVRHSLHAQGLTHRDVTDIYISHLHADHIGGLEYIGLSTMFDPTCERPRLYIDAELVDVLWNNSLKGGMGKVTGPDPEMTDYFDVHAIERNGSFEFAGIDITAVPTIHVKSEAGPMHSFGVLFTANDQTVFITTDTSFTPDHLAPQYDAADVIFHDCETSAFKTDVHPNFVDLCTLPADIQKKIWLYHYQPGELPSLDGHHFRGYVQPGQTFDI